MRRCGHDIVIAESDGSGKRCDDFLEALLGGEPIDRGLRFLTAASAVLFSAAAWLAFDCRVSRSCWVNAARWQQAVIALVRRVGQLEIGRGPHDVGLRLLQCGLRLGEAARVCIGCVNLSQKLALFNVIVDVDEPVFQITVHPGIIAVCCMGLISAGSLSLPRRHRLGQRDVNDRGSVAASSACWARFRS